MQAGDSECFILFSGDAANSCDPGLLSFLATLVVCDRKCSIWKQQRDGCGRRDGRQVTDAPPSPRDAPAEAVVLGYQVLFGGSDLLALIGYIRGTGPQPQPSSNNQTVNQTMASDFF